MAPDGNNTMIFRIIFFLKPSRVICKAKLRFAYAIQRIALHWFCVTPVINYIYYIIKPPLDFSNKEQTQSYDFCLPLNPLSVKKPERYTHLAQWLELILNIFIIERFPSKSRTKIISPLQLGEA